MQFKKCMSDPHCKNGDTELFLISLLSECSRNFKNVVRVIWYIDKFVLKIRRNNGSDPLKYTLHIAIFL